MQSGYCGHVVDLMGKYWMCEFNVFNRSIDYLIIIPTHVYACVCQTFVCLEHKWHNHNIYNKLMCLCQYMQKKKKGERNRKTEKERKGK